MSSASTVVTAAVVLALAPAGLAGFAGCSAPGAAAHPTSPSPSSSERPPAALAGGACQLLEYEEIEQEIGVSFDVAAAAQQADSFTCVLQRQDASYPDLLLAVTPTTVDVAAFRGAVAPKGAVTVSGLGRAAYSANTAAEDDAGSGVEVGWLSGNGRLIVLRYRFPPGTAGSDTAAMTPKVLALAKRLDRSSV